MKTIEVKTNHPYTVLIGEQLLPRTAELIKDVCNYQKVAIISDDMVADYYLNTVVSSFSTDKQVFCYIFPHGEQSKSADTLLQIYHFLAQNQFTRSDLIIALGGGVVGDLAGFAASSFLRGVPYVQIPTTLLAQVDSSVGGKTAINIPAGKNLVGSFYQPARVLCDTNTLSTLSKVNFSSGIAEVIKYACIYDRSLFEQIQDIQHANMTDIITRCIQIKADIVCKDEFDTGMRMILNFGHTIGHAIEKHYHFSTYTHGQGVAIGMVKMTQLSEKAGLTQPGCAQQIIKLCQSVGLPTDCEIDTQTLFDICCLDKKNLNQSIHLILLKEIGTCLIHKLSHSEFQAFLNQSKDNQL